MCTLLLTTYGVLLLSTVLFCHDHILSITAGGRDRSHKVVNKIFSLDGGVHQDGLPQLLVVKEQ